MVDETKSDSGRIEVPNIEVLEFAGGGLEECVEAVREEVTQKVMKKLGVAEIDTDEVRMMALMSLYGEVKTMQSEDVLELKVLVKVPEEAGLDEVLTKTITEALVRVAEWNAGAAASQTERSSGKRARTTGAVA